MRISDWRSDVGSSDLGRVAALIGLRATESDFLGLLGQIQGGDGMLADGLLILLVEFGVFILDDLAQANLGQFLGHTLVVDQYALNRSEERRVGKEWVSKFTISGSRYSYKKNKI